jgi:hypothetical protein
MGRIMKNALTIKPCYVNVTDHIDLVSTEHNRRQCFIDKKWRRSGIKALQNAGECLKALTLHIRIFPPIKHI